MLLMAFNGTVHFDSIIGSTLQQHCLILLSLPCHPLFMSCFVPSIRIGFGHKFAFSGDGNQTLSKVCKGHCLHNLVLVFHGSCVP